MRVPVSRSVLLAFAVCLGSAPAAPAKVFMRWRVPGSTQRAIQALRGRTAYQADIRVNGGSGRLTVIHCDAPLDLAMARLARLRDEGAPILAWQGEQLGFAMGFAENRVWRSLALAGSRPGTSLFFLFDQSRAAYAASLQATGRAAPEDIPRFPGAAPVWSMANEDTRTSLRSSACDRPPDSVIAYFNDALTAAGWQRLTGTAPGGAGLLLLRREKRLCVVSADVDPDTGTTRITVLHKRIDLK